MTKMCSFYEIDVLATLQKIRSIRSLQQGTEECSKGRRQGGIWGSTHIRITTNGRVWDSHGLVCG